MTTAVLVTIDTLRADRLGCGGYPEARTPNLDALAARGVAFREAITSVPVTLPAIGTILTGESPVRHGVRDNGWFALDSGIPTLAERFRAAGWGTEAVVASAVLSEDRGLARGFDRWDDDFSPPYEVFGPEFREFRDEMARDRRRASTVSDLAIARIASPTKEKRFFFFHYFDPHMHLDPPPPFARAHPSRPYDGEVSFVDHEIGRLLRALPDPSRTLIVVVADHGESMGEHGEPQHGFLLYDSTLHVPWIVAGPGVPRGRLRTDPVGLVDLTPTIASALGLAAIGSGRRLDWSRPDPDPPGFYSETLRPLVSYGWSALFSYRQGGWKVVSGGDRVELYDLSADPGERSPVRDPAREHRLLAALTECRAGDPPPEEIRARARADERAQSQELLESLGYTGNSGSSPARPHPADALQGWNRTQETRVFLHRADVELAQGHFDLAIAWADSGLARGESADLWFLRGEAARRAGRAQVARNAFERALRLEPGHSFT
ncbi:MAG: sulfatase-like hydrolase/transferase, partial [Gemmatimonadetes bacterium]|nr:sulfatase-like hydrolase/transferase [Gemmatimonadota bacterium]